MTTLAIPNYDHFLHDLKARIRSDRSPATLSANRELVLLYWQIGRDILKQLQRVIRGSRITAVCAKYAQRRFSPNL